MARIIYSLGELAGSIGDLTFQRNNSGTIVRTRPRQNKSSTLRQTARHTQHIDWLAKWQQLTQNQRDDWNTYASTWTKINKFGQVKTLTGQNWFESSNYYMSDMGQAMLANPPGHTLPLAPPDLDILVSETEIQVSFVAPFDYTYDSLIMWASTPTKKNNFQVNQIRRKVTVLNATPANPLDITALWETAIGLPWEPLTLFPNANLFVCLQSISKGSGIASTFICNSINTLSIVGNSLLSDAGVQLQTDGGTNINTDT